MKKRQPNMSRIGRFWSKVTKTDTCWLWNGDKSKFGHGRFLYDNLRVNAHRYSYETFVGPIPEGLLVCHKCDVPACVNPDHLFLGTQKDNIQDCVKKGRWTQAKLKKLHPEWCVRGSKAGNSKLKEEQVVTMRSLLACGCTLLEVGSMFGVTEATACAIRQNRTWKHVEAPWLRL